MKSIRQLVLSGLSLALSLAVLTPLVSGLAAEKEVRFDGLDEATKAIAEHVAGLMLNQAQTVVDVREFEFNGPEGVENGNGLGITASIQQHLQAGKVDVRAAEGALVLKGVYRIAEHSNSGKKCIIVEAQLTDAEGNGIGNATQYVLTDEKTLRTLLPGTGALPLQAGVDEDGEAEEVEVTRANAIFENFLEKSPPQQTSSGEGVVFRQGTDSPYGIEILVLRGEDYVPAPISTSASGETIVALGDEDIYAVRLVNDDPERPAGVELTIDGVNSLLFSNAAFRQVGKWVVQPGATAAQVRGWHQRDGSTRSFQVTDFGKAVAGKAGQPQPKAGIITASFCVAAPAGGKLPADEPKLSLAARGELATGEGPLVAQTAAPVAMKFGVTRATVSIRYVPEFAANLPPANQ